MKKFLMFLVCLPHFLLAQVVHQHHSLSDKPAVHGMLVFGTSKVYLSHLPMFYSPHDYQVLIEASLSADALKIYQNALVKTPHSLYTIVPEKFVLPSLLTETHAFKGDLYAGHFEKGGVRIAHNITIDVVKVIYFQKLTPLLVKPKKSHVILFGNHEEQFIMHQIHAAPDFDQVVQVHLSDPQILLQQKDKYLILRADYLDADIPFSKIDQFELATAATNQRLTFQWINEVYLVGPEELI